MIKTNMYPRLLALMIIMIMSAGGVWGQTETIIASWVSSSSSAATLTNCSAEGALETQDSTYVMKLSAGSSNLVSTSNSVKITLTSGSLQTGDIVTFKGWGSSSSKNGFITICDGSGYRNEGLYSNLTGDLVGSTNTSQATVTATVNSSGNGKTEFYVTRANGSGTTLYISSMVITRPVTSTNITSFTIGGGDSQTFTSYSATNAFATYSDGGESKTLAITTESSTATVMISAKKPGTANPWSGAGFGTALAKDGSIHTTTLIAPKPGNECYYYIDVEDGGSHAYYELKLTTPAGGTTTEANSSSEPTDFTSDYTYIFDDLTNTGTETPMGNYLLFGDNHFLLGGVISSYPKSQNSTFGDGTHYNSYRLKGLNQTYIAFKLSAGQTVKVYGHSESGRYFVLTTSKEHTNINNDGIVVASSGTEYLEYTATEAATYYLASYAKNGESWGDGADQYLCAIVVEMKKSGVESITVGGTTYEPSAGQFAMTIPAAQENQSVSMTMAKWNDGDAVYLAGPSSSSDYAPTPEDYSTIAGTTLNLTAPQCGQTNYYKLKVVEAALTRAAGDETIYTIALSTAPYTGTEIESITVGSDDITATRDIYGCYTYTDAYNVVEGMLHTLSVTTKSATAVVTYAGPFRAVNELATEFKTLTNGTSTVMVPNTPSVANYYCIKVTDGEETGYSWVAIQRAATDGDSKVLGHHKVWDGAAAFGYDGKAITFSSNGVLTDGYIKYYTQQTNGVQVLSDGLYLSGSGNFGNKDRIVQLKVSGKGTLKVRYTYNASDTRYLKVLKTGEASATEYSDANTILSIPYNTAAPTSFYLYSSHSGIYINYLEWIPAADDNGVLPTAEIVATTGNRVESGSSLTKVFATASFPYGDLTDKIQYTIKSGGDLIEETVLTPNATTHELTITANAGIAEEKPLVITASVPLNYDYYANSVDIPITVYPKETSTELNSVSLNSVVMTKLDAANNHNTYGETYLKEVEANDESSGTFTMLIEKKSSTATVSISPALRATVTTPANLAYTIATSATVYMPEAPGYSTYYYIKVAEISGTPEYHLVRLHRKAGNNDLEVWDQTMGWSNSDVTNCKAWITTENQTETSITQDHNFRVYVTEGTSEYYSAETASGLTLSAQGNMNGTNGFVGCVAEIKVSGRGQLKIKQSSGTFRLGNSATYNSSGLRLNKPDLTTEDGYTVYKYENDVPASIFISSNSANTIQTVIWEPDDIVPQLANQPYIVWEGTEGFIYGSNENVLKATAYYHGSEVGGVTYTVLRGSENVGKTGYNTSLADLVNSDGEISLGGYHAGTVMIRATVAGSGTYTATNSYYIFNVSKQTPTIIVDEITTTVGGVSAKTFKEYVTRVEGVKIETNGTSTTETISDRTTDANSTALTAEVSYTAKTADGYYTVSAEDKAQGEKMGRGQVILKWTPNNSHKANYLGTETTADVVVISSSLTMRFTKTAGTGGCGRPYKAHVLCMDGTTKTKVEGLTIKYVIMSDDTGGATYNADHTAIIPGNTPGTIAIKAYFERNPKVNDLNSYYADTDTGDSRLFTLTVQDANTLTMISDKENFVSSNLSQLSWENESRPSAANVNYPTPYQFTTGNFYFASNNVHAEQHHFRFYPSNRDELVQTTINTIPVEGLYIKDKDSYLSFYAQGSATLELKGYASVARVVEVWSINDFGWTGNADPHFEDGVTKVAEIKIPAGTFDVEEELAVAGCNYYFLKTTFGGLYLSQVIWKESRVKPFITITPETYEMTPSTKVINILDDGQPQTYTPFKITAWTYPTNSDSNNASAPGTNHILLKKTETGYTASGVSLHFESTDPSIASINPTTSVITPNMPGTVEMYVYIDAGEVGSVKYGSQRARFEITITGKVADVFFGDGLSETSVVYSNKTGMVISDNCDTRGTWLTPTVRDAETYNTLSPAAYKLAYRLETLDGKPYSADLATIDSKTGVVSFPAGSTIKDGDQFRVVVRFTSDLYVNQQSYYIVKYLDRLTEPTVSYNAEDGMKELNTPNLDGAFGTGTRWSFDKEREYFIPAGQNAELTFTLPTPLNGLTMHAKILDNLKDSPPVSGFDEETTGSTNTMTVTIESSSDTYQVKYAWMRVTTPIAEGTDAGEPNYDDYTNIWNGVYKITFLATPSSSVSGSSSSASRTVTITSNNPTNAANTTSTYYTQKLYYSEDSSTPTGDSNLYNSSSEPTYTSNAVLHIVEIFSPTGGFTDGTSNFSTTTLNNVEVEIDDPTVIAAKDFNSGNQLKSNWENQLLLPKNRASIQDGTMRIMFGGDGGYYYYKGNDGFLEGGMGWKTSVNNKDAGIPFYADIYKEYIQSKESSDLGGKDPNPRTEYNGDIGGKGTNSSALPPYMTPITGAFIRIEPEYNGIATIWIRQNGASASSAWGKTHESGANNDTRQSKAQLTRRPVFIMDENGKLLPNNTAQYNSGYSLLSQYKDINGVCADVSKRSTLDADFMWGWNYFDNIVEDRKTINRKTMEYYHMKYGFYVDFDLDESGDGYYEEFKVSKNSDYKTNTSRTANGADISKIPITDLIYTDNPEVDEDWETFKFVAGGYETPMPNYVRYRIPVKAGKTYFLSGRQTKNAFCAVKFDKFTSGNEAKQVYINERDDDNTTSASMKDDKYPIGSLSDGDLISVTLNRTFTEGYWHPIVLPFSVSETKMREIFGDDVQVLYLDTEYRYEGVGTGSNSFTMPFAVKTVSSSEIEGFGKSTCDIMFTKHHYQMLYANTPAFIKPTFKWYNRKTDYTVDKTSTQSRTDPWGNTITETDCKYQRSNILFKNVTYVSGGPKTVDIGAGYDLVGTYDYKAAQKGDLYYINNETSGTTSLHHNNTTAGVNFKATRCWIQRRSGVSAAPIRRVGSRSFMNDDLSFGISMNTDEPVNDFVEQEQNVKYKDPGVYTLSGQRVSTGSREGLPRGIYIQYGHKFVVK